MAKTIGNNANENLGNDFLLKTAGKGLNMFIISILICDSFEKF